MEVIVGSCVWGNQLLPRLDYCLVLVTVVVSGESEIGNYTVVRVESGKTTYCLDWTVVVSGESEIGNYMVVRVESGKPPIA